MKKHVFRIVTLSTIIALSVGLVVVTSGSYKEADAYNESALPTTINLNDCTEQEIRSYYSDLNAYSSSERQGTNLLKNLKPILLRNQKYYSYDEDKNNKIWQIYEIADRDWEKSPASAISHGTYNPTTNEITNYKYGSSGDNPYLHALYINRNVENQTRAWGDHGNSSDWGMNREHIWAKSHGFNAEGDGGARGDPMHLWAANGYANNIHSNNFYAFVDKTRTYTDCGDKHHNIYNNLSGFSKNAGGNSKIFEPQKCDKGDIARAIFYMAARYNNYSGTDNNINTNNPYLVLANDLSENSRSGGTSSSNDPYAMGLLSDLLAWNKLDPVDEYEIHRNNLLYNNYTNNRNPFIDFPEWADAIWGTADLDGTNYNSSINSYASPSSDPISVATPVTPTFAISNNSISLEVGETANVSARNAETTITWTVGNSSVVSLNRTSTENNESVTITALAAGTTTVTATSGSDSASCTVTVTDNFVPPVGDYVKVASYDFETNGTGTGDYNASTLLNRFNVCVQTGAGLSNIVTSVTNVSKMYAGYSGHQDLGIKFGSSSDNGSFTANLSTEVSRVVVKTAGWGTSDKLTIGGASSQTPGVAYTGSNPIKTLTFDITASDSVSFLYEKRGFIQSIDFYIAGEVTDNPSNHLDSCTTFATITGTEVVSGTGDTVSSSFEDSGLDNETAIGSSLTVGEVTLTGDRGTHGSLSPRYFTSGHQVRMYTGNTVTFSSSYNITRIEFTFSGTGSNGLTADVGTLANGVWTGSSNSIVFTNSNDGSTQVRFTDVVVTYGDSSVSVNKPYLRFGATIAQDDWDTIASNWEISDYGVMLVKETTLHSVYKLDSIEEAHDANKALAIGNKGSGETPIAEGDNYVFAVKINMTDVNYRDIAYCAAPFIVIDDTYYFLDEICKTFNEVLDECIDDETPSDLSHSALLSLKTNNN